MADIDMDEKRMYSHVRSYKFRGNLNNGETPIRPQLKHSQLILEDAANHETLRRNEFAGDLSNAGQQGTIGHTYRISQKQPKNRITRNPIHIRRRRYGLGELISANPIPFVPLVGGLPFTPCLDTRQLKRIGPEHLNLFLFFAGNVGRARGIVTTYQFGRQLSPPLLQHQLSTRYNNRNIVVLG